MIYLLVCIIVLIVCVVLSRIFMDDGYRSHIGEYDRMVSLSRNHPEFFPSWSVGPKSRNESELCPSGSLGTNYYENDYLTVTFEPDDEATLFVPVETKATGESQSPA